MKKIFVGLTVLLCIPIMAYSQDSVVKPRKFHLGFNGSINTSLLDISNNSPAYSSTITSENIPKIGYKVGAFVNFDLSRHFFLSSGLSYVTNKTKTRSPLIANYYSQDPDYLTREEFYSWIEMPVNINYIINPKSTCRFFVGAGFSMRRLLKASVQIVAERASSVNTISGNEISMYSSLNDWSLLGAAHVGVQLPISKQDSFLFSLSFEKSFFNIYRQTNPDQDSSAFTLDYSTVDSEARINTFNFNAAYVLR